MRQAFIDTLCELAGKNDRIMLITGDLGFGVFDNFRNKFANQFVNAGVAEQNMTGLATGLALEGRVVFTYSIGNFSTFRCLEQIRNDVCYHNANVKIVSIGGGFSYGALGISHHATEDLSIMRSLPNLNVLSPCDKWETQEAVKVLANNSVPCFLRLDKSSGRQVKKDNEIFQLGKARLVREGSDITIIVTGGILEEVQDAAERLQKDNIEVRILSIHTVKPFDADAIIQACHETGGIITVEENTISGGLGSIVAEILVDENLLPTYFKRMGLDGKFSSIVGTQKYLRKKYGIDADSIESAVRGVLKTKNSF